jgi:transposase
VENKNHEEAAQAVWRYTFSLVYHPGDCAQVDFFDVAVEEDGVRRNAWKFVMRLMFSGRDFVWLYDDCDQISFLDSHVRAFAFFGSVPRRIILDYVPRNIIRHQTAGELRNTRPSQRVLRVQKAFDRAEIPYEIPEEMNRRLWWKLMVNAGINQASAVMRAPYGVFQSSQDAQSLMEALMREVIEILRQAAKPR